MKIILSGGGTMGPVTPLLAVVEEMRRQGINAEFLWVGTKTGPERKLVESYGIRFIGVTAAKLRRYFDWQNFFIPAQVIAGFFQSVLILRYFKPDLILSAGGFVSVPLVFASIFFSVKVLIHQQDVTPGLANRLMAPFASKITVSLEESLLFFDKRKTVLTGNPFRASLLSGVREKAITRFNLKPNLPLLLVLGGGTGSIFLNQTVIRSLPALTKICQIIHLVGEGKVGAIGQENYQPVEFLTGDFKDVLATADLVVSRAGMGTLTELSALGKPAIIVPMADTHQEANAFYFSRNNSVVLIGQSELTAEVLFSEVKRLLASEVERHTLSRNIQTLLPLDAAERLVGEIEMLTGQKD